MLCFVANADSPASQDTQTAFDSAILLPVKTKIMNKSNKWKVLKEIKTLASLTQQRMG